ncbi:hypothetical protein TYRP_011831 [Tyrophagus putrescentiae]|nr:hypothetical protein TYRP_011831 [Tyrophagus putrescentiae]
MSQGSKAHGNKKAIEQLVAMVEAINPDEVDEEIKGSLHKLHHLVRSVQVSSVGSGRMWAPLGLKEAAPPAKVEAPKEEEKKAEAKEAKEPINAKAAAKALKSAKNQFAINRLLFMLLDLDPAALGSKMIDELKAIYDLLVAILSKQSGPKKKEEGGKKEEGAKKEASKKSGKK